MMRTWMITLVAALAMPIGCIERTQDPADLEAKANEMQADTPSSQADQHGAGDPQEGSPDAPDPGGTEADVTPEGAGEGEPMARPLSLEEANPDSPMVTISGSLIADSDITGAVDIDCFAADGGAENARKLVNKVKVPQPGPYSFKMPKDYGAFSLEAFIDNDGDGPDDGDPRGHYPGNPLTVGSIDLDGIDIELVRPRKDSTTAPWRGGGRRDDETAP